MSLIQDLEGLYKLDSLDDPRAEWFVDLNDPQGAGIRIDPWGEADDLVLSYREWGKPQAIDITADRITGTWNLGRSIFLDDRATNLDPNVPSAFPGLKITLRMTRTQTIPDADPDGKIRFRFPVVQGWDLYDFDPQPALTPEQVALGDVRPDHVLWSVAVYHRTKGHNHYRVGKACHIFRPFVRDSLGNFSWGEWEVDAAGQALVKAFPAAAFVAGAAWWDVDADIGRTDAGATTRNHAYDYVYAAGPFPANDGDGTADAVHWYLNAQANGYNATFGFYGDSSGPSGSPLGVSNNHTSVTTSIQWVEIAISGGSITNGNDYWAAECHASGYFYGKYDTTAGFHIHYDAYTYSAGTLSDPYVSSGSLPNEKHSVHVVYTPSAGGLSIPIAMHHYKQQRAA